MLKQMTLQEKVSLLSGNQFVTHTIPRLEITGFAMSDGPQGVRDGPGNINQACAFPCGAALAATWDAELAAAYGKAVGLEGRAGNAFSVGAGAEHLPGAGERAEFRVFGEDPYLAGMMAATWTKACSEQGVVPTVKHYAANNQENQRNSEDSVVDERTMHEVYLPAFQTGGAGGGTVAVMCSYNRLNGHYASNNEWLLKDVLKKQWGFAGAGDERLGGVARCDGCGQGVGSGDAQRDESLVGEDSGGDDGGDGEGNGH